jgi:hypothetical protein
VGFKFLLGQGAIVTANILLDVLSIYPPPVTTWTDNGTAFKGDFDGMLKQRAIMQTPIEAFSHQQTDMCARYWRPLEVSPSPADVLAPIRDYYPTPHFGPREIRRSRRVGDMRLDEV